MIAGAHVGPAGAGAGALGWGLALCVAVAAAVGAYGWAARRRRASGRPWSRLRQASFTAGALVAAAALSPPVEGPAADDFRMHAAQHLALGMLGPLAIVMGAPVTLALATLPRGRPRRALVAAITSAPARAVTHPVAVVALVAGGMYLLYATPLYGAAAGHGSLHALVHGHVFTAGVLLAWVVAGPDPGPHRPALPGRIATLIAAAALHGLLAKLVYAHGLGPGAAHPLDEVRDGAQLMYYGGEAVDLLLAVALFAWWYRSRGRARRRAGRAAAPSPARA